MCRTTPAIQAAHEEDLAASYKRLNAQMETLGAALAAKKYPKVCASLRAINEETTNALRIATQLSLADDLAKHKPRFIERGQS